MKTSVPIRVLLVEDNPGDVRLLQAMLSKSEMVRFEMTHAGALSTAIECLAGDTFDVLLLDLSLPDSCGLETVAHIRRHASDLPIVILTGLHDDALALRTVKAGAQDYVVKGEFQSASLHRCLRYAIERKGFENTLREKDEQIRNSQKLEAVGALAGGIAHEFNNLLQAILGYVDFAMDGMSADDPRFEDLTQAYKAAERAGQLTRQLLGFSRRRPLNVVDVEPNDLIRDFLKMLRPLIGEKVDVQTRLGEQIGIVRGDAAQIEQVLMNLCINARDAMPDGGQLLIETEIVSIADAADVVVGTARIPESGRYAAISVTDTGSGMSAETVERMFEPFYTTKEVGKGTGLGLSVVYGIVQQHGGTIDVTSDPESGTTFRLLLPLADKPDCRPNSTPAVSSEAHTRSTETILIAEDDPMVRKLAVRILEDAGYSILIATNGEEAVWMYEQYAETISLCVLDVVMPKLNGHEVYRRIQALNPKVRAVFCTGYDPEEPQLESVVDCGLPLVVKPFQRHKLLDTVRDALDAVDVACLELVAEQGLHPQPRPHAGAWEQIAPEIPASMR